jgi:hypothetical protein
VEKAEKGGKRRKSWKKVEKATCLFLFFCVIVTPMSIPISTTEPTALITGDTITWQISLADYPATDGWTLKYTLLNAAALLTITASAAEADHLVSIPAAISAAYIPGDYKYQKYVERGADETLERITLDEGTIAISAGIFSATAATDTRTQNRRILDAINAVLEGRASRSDMEYTINTGNSSRTLKSMTPEMLLSMQSTYTLMVWRELHPGKLCPQIRLNAGGFRG